jgi:hypothetical protein
MGLFSENIIERRLDVKRKFQFMLALRAKIDSYKSYFIRNRDNNRANLNYNKINDWCYELLPKYNLYVPDADAYIGSFGKYRYIDGELYIVIKVSDSQEEHIRARYSHKMNTLGWAEISEARQRMKDEIESSCEPTGEVILRFDKDMNCLKEKVTDWNYSYFYLY